MNKVQAEKANRLLELHRSEKILILPNIWDVLGAKLLEHLGFPAIATASASVAFSQGVDDGEVISFDEHVAILKKIAQSVKVPVTADIERGYADSEEELSKNTERLLEAGIVGINIEDSIVEGGELVSIKEQSRRLRAIRETADGLGVPLVINARTDVFLAEDYDGDRVAEAVKRSQAYREAGANCLFVVGCSGGELAELLKQVELPVNVFAHNDLPSIKELEKMGVARLSIGPALLRSSISRMKDVAETLQNYGSYDVFTEDVLSSDDVREILGI